MSDTLAEFRRKNDAQFEIAQRQFREIVMAFFGLVAEDLVFTTPGPGLQIETDYVATGRLRAGWRWTVEAPPDQASNFTDGPYDPSGYTTVSEIEAAVNASVMVPTSYLWNDVGYGSLVHDGRGRHKEPRPWVDLVAQRAPSHLEEARAKVMGG